VKKPAPAVEFAHIFHQFLEKKESLKTITVASCDAEGNPNSAPKLLVDASAPNRIYYLDYPYNRTYCNLMQNHRLSLSIMDERAFKGYRLTGVCKPLTEPKKLEEARRIWEKRADRYLIDRMVERIRGHDSAREAEDSLPQDYVIMEFVAREASVVKPDRALLAKYHLEHPED